MKTSGSGRAARHRGSAHDAASEAVRAVRELAGAALSDEESAEWTEASEMLADLHLDRDCIAAGLAGLLVERGIAGLDTARQHLGGEAQALLEGLARFDELRSIRTEDAAPAGRGAQAERLRKLLLSVVDDVRILIVQIALTLHRLRYPRGLSDAERERLAREGLELYAPLASRLGIWQYKWEIEDLAFRESDPATYKSIAAQLNERRIDRERYVEEVVSEVGTELRRAGIDAEVTGRAKHIHSIWRKMQRKALSIEQAGIEQLFDLRAIRLLVGTVAECYSALGTVHGLWTHIPREFDDYITKPKPQRVPVAAHRGQRAGRQDSGGADPHPRDARPGGARRGGPLAVQGGGAGCGAGARYSYLVAAAAPGDPRGGGRVRVPARLARPGARFRAGVRLHARGATSSTFRPARPRSTSPTRSTPRSVTGAGARRSTGGSCR